MQGVFPTPNDSLSTVTITRSLDFLCFSIREKRDQQSREGTLLTTWQNIYVQKALIMMGKLLI